MREKLDKLRAGWGRAPAVFKIGGASLVGPLFDLLEAMVQALEKQEKNNH